MRQPAYLALFADCISTTNSSLYSVLPLRTEKSPRQLKPSKDSSRPFIKVTLDDPSFTANEWRPGLRPASVTSLPESSFTTESLISPSIHRSKVVRQSSVLGEPHGVTLMVMSSTSAASSRGGESS